MNKYFTNPIDGFGNGAMLDLRLRIAIEGLHKNPGIDPAALLDAAEQLVALAEERGYIEPFPDGIGPELQGHAERIVAWQVAQQKAAEKATRDAGLIARPTMGMAKPN